MGQRKSTMLTRSVLLVSSLLGVAAQSGDMDFDLGSLLGGLGQKSGNKGVCADNKIPAPTENPNYKIEANGCGPAGMQVPEEFGLFKCCNGHDLCFGVCGTTHQYCEKVFKKCMAKVCKGHSGGKQAECRKQADSFSGMTGAFGGGFHVNGQKRACDCYADKISAQARHEDYLMSFYQKYNTTLATKEQVRRILDTHKGREGEAYFTVMKKYAKTEIVWDNIKDEF